MAQNRGYNNVIIKTDCMLKNEMIKEGLGSLPSITIVRKIKMLYQQFETVKLQFVHREENIITNWLKRSCSSNDVNLVPIDIPSSHVRKLLLDDKVGYTNVRYI